MLLNLVNIAIIFAMLNLLMALKDMLAKSSRILAAIQGIAFNHYMPFSPVNVSHRLDQIQYSDLRSLFSLFIMSNHFTVNKNYKPFLA